jgi:glyoxylase-like metal-dependent hydrolase (beta-lactamase superfamily II)
MWINKPGKITAHLTMLGEPRMPAYCITSKRTALVDAGVLPLAPFYREHFGPGKLQPSFILITHTHYDHVGCLGVLRKLAPRAIVVGSLPASNLLSNRKVYEFILDMNKKLAPGDPAVADPAALLKAADLHIDMVAGEGEIIDLGDGVSLEVHLTPGHTRCSASYLLRPDKVLIGGDNLGGYQSESEAKPLFTSSYRDYVQSLRKLLALDLDAVALPHQGVLTGADGRRHLENALRSAEAFKDQLRALLAQKKTPEEIAEALLPGAREGLAAFEPEFSTRINLAAMALAVRKEFETH